MKVTRHGRDRMKERQGLAPSAAERLAGRALASGLRHADTTGPLKKYLSHLFQQYGTANNLRVYGEWIYVFCDEALVTVLALPQEYRKLAHKTRKRLDNQPPSDMKESGSNQGE